MRITAVTRYKHGNLYHALMRLGWTQVDLAEKAGLSVGAVNRIINLTQRPSANHANAIQRALGEAGEFIDVLEEWPESFQGLGRGSARVETLDVPTESLIGCREALMIEDSNERTTCLEGSLDAVMDGFPEKTRRLMEMRFWENKTIDECARETGLSRTRVSQIERQTIRKLRHPSRLAEIKDAMELLLDSRD